MHTLLRTEATDILVIRPLQEKTLQPLIFDCITSLSECYQEQLDMYKHSLCLVLCCATPQSLSHISAWNANPPVSSV